MDSQRWSTPIPVKGPVKMFTVPDTVQLDAKNLELLLQLGFRNTGEIALLPTGYKLANRLDYPDYFMQPLFLRLQESESVPQVPTNGPDAFRHSIDGVRYDRIVGGRQSGILVCRRDKFPGTGRRQVVGKDGSAWVG